MTGHASGPGRPPWTNYQGKHKINSGSPQGLPAGPGILRSHRPQWRGRYRTEIGHEDRRHWRQRPHRIQGRDQASPEGPRGRGGVAQHRASTPSPARGWPRRLPARGRRRRGELALLRGQGGHGILRDRRAATCLPRKRPPASATMSRSRSSGPSVFWRCGYFLAKLAQENLIKASKIPYTIVRATQFFEFLDAIAQAATEGQRPACRLPWCSPWRRMMSPPPWRMSRSGHR